MSKLFINKETARAYGKYAGLTFSFVENGVLHFQKKTNGASGGMVYTAIIKGNAALLQFLVQNKLNLYIKAKYMKTKKIIKSNSTKEEFLIENPPYTVFGTPSLPESQSIIMKVGGLKEMIKDLDDEDSFRIEWFLGNKATEYSFLKEQT